MFNYTTLWSLTYRLISVHQCGQEQISVISCYEQTENPNFPEYEVIIFRRKYSASDPSPTMHTLPNACIIQANQSILGEYAGDVLVSTITMNSRRPICIADIATSRYDRHRVLPNV